jgi:hypothetical protein
MMYGRPLMAAQSFISTMKMIITNREGHPPATPTGHVLKPVVAICIRPNQYGWREICHGFRVRGHVLPSLSSDSNDWTATPRSQLVAGHRRRDETQRQSADFDSI